MAGFFVAIDIGNTNSHVGVFQKGELAAILDVKTEDFSSSPIRILNEKLDEEFGVELQDEVISGVGIASVVEGLDKNIRTEIAKQTGEGKAVSIVKRKKLPISVDYAEGLGIDRLIAAFGGFKIFDTSVMVVDIGTAVTLDVVHEGVFKGGVILAGAGLRARALEESTSALPYVEPVDTPPSVIGKNTESCIESGLFHGLRAEITGLSRKFQAELGEKLEVVLTGKGSVIYEGVLDENWHIENNLVLKGIHIAGGG